ncbi:hypothetical protein P873_06745 [Arenimonas composti TR7-09 = DSM 18010]|uniref:SOS cell division inhibitor SulA n=1 Tax=Arenimonas composti TR7-09 = DSM 18010 TaxID=1121013 RepID=A0A091BF48_9GAMM|nr:hypothetical protein P873_06745 [Arenimonas composti TR7-09 = DSM 18010]
MNAVVSLEPLLASRQLWRGQVSANAPARLPTGFAALDAVLPGGGWPEAALSELLPDLDGLGELSLLLPALVRLTAAGREIVWVDPPYRPCLPALLRAGLDPTRLHLVDSGGETAWALEQCLRSQACGAVVGWLPRADDRCLRRLQVAAETGQAPGFLFRPPTAVRQPSPAALRLQVAAGGRVRVVKCRGGRAGDEIRVTSGEERVTSEGARGAATHHSRAARRAEGATRFPFLVSRFSPAGETTGISALFPLARPAEGGVSHAGKGI